MIFALRAGDDLRNYPSYWLCKITGASKSLGKFVGQLFLTATQPLNSQQSPLSAMESIVCPTPTIF